MADKLLIVLANADLSNADELAPPILQATVAAAMEYEVEILLTGQAARLATNGVAQSIILDKEKNKTVLDYIRDAKAAGVSVKLSTPTCDDGDGDLLPEIDETVGSAYVINEAMDDSVVTFTY